MTVSPTDEVMERTLPAVASRAALQLDNLRLGRSRILDAVDRLATILLEMKESKDNKSYVNPLQAVVVNNAFRDASILHPLPSTLDQIAEEAGRIHERLLSVTGSSHSPDQIELESLIGFCVALSKRAAHLNRAPQDRRPGNPFRR